jgi:POT family proton-dependent oligopeptide transporter
VSRHPRGLATLWFTEFWERFSYYGMRALLVLFMTATPAQGGLGFSAAKAGGIYGLYTAFAYLSSLPGGWLADVLIGQRPAIVVGGIIIACGHFSMALPGIGGFYIGLVLVVIGTGLLKPNVSSMVGQLYPDGGARRDAAFSIFYMGINLGSFSAPLVTGFLGQRVNWHLGFGAAGVGMIVGVAQYLAGTKHLGTAGMFVRRAPRRISARAPLVVALIAVSALSLLALAPITPPSAATITSIGGVIVLGLPVVYFAWILTAGGLSPDERTRIGVVAVLFLFSAMFWSGFEQGGSSLNLFAQRDTDLVVFGHAMPASWFQSLNGLLIILLAPVFAWLWVALAARRAEPSVPAKFVCGLSLTSLGFATMALAATRAAGGHLVSPWWLVATYVLHTTGELCLSPVGLSTVTGLAPSRLAGQTMGIWFMSLAVGNWIGGQIAGRFDAVPLPHLFGGVAIALAGAGILMALLIRPIAAVTARR